MKDFRAAAQASPNPLIKFYYYYYYFIMKYYIIELKEKIRTIPTKARNGTPIEIFVMKKVPRQLQLIGICRDTKGGSITVPLTSCLTGLESAV